jgi:hypothetical protein
MILNFMQANESLEDWQAAVVANMEQCENV